MIKGVIENTHIISSKITKFIWFFDYYNFSKIDMYFEMYFEMNEVKQNTKHSPKKHYLNIIEENLTDQGRRMLNPTT